MSALNWLLLLFSVPVMELAADKPKRSSLNQLTRMLLRHYNTGVRPVVNWTDPTLIYIDFIIQSILEVDGQTQKVTTSVVYQQFWTDEFLVWDPEEFDGINNISLPTDAIWLPDIIITEFVDRGSSEVPYVYVNSSGVVKNSMPIQVVAACDLQIYAFPFDKQNCTLTFRSLLHSVREVDLAFWRDAEKIAGDKRYFMSDGEWELLSVPSHYWRLHMDDEDYAHIQFNVLIRRRPLLYVVALLIPSIFLMVVDVISFYLPPNTGTRISFKVSILLGYTVFRVNLTDEIPVTSMNTPLIGVFFAVCMALLVLSLAKSILVVKLLYHSEREVREMSLSACLLDHYGSCSQSFGESAFTSVRTLDDLELEQSSGSDDDLVSLGETPLSVSSPRLERLLYQLSTIRWNLQQAEEDGAAQSDWLALCHKVDLFLFRLYLLVLTTYSITLLALWGSWSSV
ncbi:5-hydroxytryptamine receptor 3B [Engraulis encrasicolus]|uniref:5-hydroxytryptamine receptor 3B n=1 Tax=Engraulis encrasicolus TaxID=184585 RepID=UPI002FD2EB22